MITVEQALEFIKSTVHSFGTEQIPLSQSLGRILKEDWFTDRPLPPYDRVTMDGIAIRFADFENGNRVFPIQGLCAAGMPQGQLQNGCLEVMTGAVMPRNADVVIRYEDVDIKDQLAHVNLESVKQFQNIHFKGSDRKEAEWIVPKHTRIGAPEMGISASIGNHLVKVSKLPKTIIVSTGDELVPIDQTPASHQIRRSNVHSIAALLKKWTIEADLSHLDDKKEDLLNAFEDILNNYDLVVISGGVSKGKLDFIPEVLDELGVEKKFHKVQQRPGKPFWFGHKNTCTLFALPGNPVSSFMCATRYINFWLEHCLLGKEDPKTYAVLDEDVHFKPDLTYFLEVSLQSAEDGRLMATPVKGNGSGDLANLNLVDAFMELPKGNEVYQAGGVYPIYSVRNYLT